MRREFLEMVKTEVLERVENLKGNTVYTGDLGMELTQYENANGSWSCSTYKDIQNIKEYFEECREFVEWYEENYGVKIEVSPLTEPEKFFCSVMIFAIDNAYSQAIYNADCEDDETTIDDDFCRMIREELENITEVF